jgi:nicotinamidase-related amidase
VERALLEIDVQNDFCPDGSLPVPEGDRVVPVINRLAPRFAKVVATQDWHPPGHVSFASSHPGTKPFQIVDLPGGEKQTLWPEHCLAGSRGAQLHPGLDSAAVTLVLRKGTRRELDSYSAFFENDRQSPTGLSGWLRELGIGELFLAGLATDVCVYYTALDALRLGFAVRLVEDACRGIDVPAGSLRERLQELIRAGVRILRSNEV